MGLNQMAGDIAEQIKKTREFAELKQEKIKIDSNREIIGRIDEFKKLEKKVLSSGDKDKERELAKVFNELSRIPEVSRFLKAEQAFNAMVLSVFKTINDSIEAGLKH